MSRSLLYRFRVDESVSKDSSEGEVSLDQDSTRLAATTNTGRVEQLERVAQETAAQETAPGQSSSSGIPSLLLCTPSLIPESPDRPILSFPMRTLGNQRRSSFHGFTIKRVVTLFCVSIAVWLKDEVC